MSITTKLEEILDSEFTIEEKKNTVLDLLRSEDINCRSIGPYMAARLYENYSKELPESYFKYMSPVTASNLITRFKDDERINWHNMYYSRMMEVALENVELAKKRLDFKKLTYRSLAEFINADSEDSELTPFLSTLVHPVKSAQFVAIVDKSKRKRLRLGVGINLYFKLAMNYKELFNELFPYNELTENQCLEILEEVSSLSIESLCKLKRRMVSVKKIDRIKTNSVLSDRIVLAFIKDHKILDNKSLQGALDSESVKNILLIDPSTTSKLPLSLLGSKDTLTLLERNVYFHEHLDLSKVLAADLLNCLYERPHMVKTLGTHNVVKIALKELLKYPDISSDTIRGVLSHSDLTDVPYQNPI